MAVTEDSGFPMGATVDARIGERDVPLRVVAVLPMTFAGGSMLLPVGAVPAAVAARAPSETIVRLAPGADAGAVRGALGEFGQVRTLQEWIGQSSNRQQEVSTGIMTVVLGLAGLYALIAVVNAVVIAAAERRREFAVARMSGLTRAQVVRMALLESWAVAAIGLLLGGLGAAGTWVGIGAATERVAGQSTIVVPWTLLGIVVAGALLVVGAASVWTAWSATRARPVSLAGAAE